MKPLIRYEGLHCANCGTLMQGEFCHACGQSLHSVLKPMHGMIEETVETVLHIDGRIVHTLPPLLFKPGFLTLEYFRGRRMRYIAPFRLMFVLCLLAFFVSHLRVEESHIRLDPNTPVSVTGHAFKVATTPAGVKLVLQQQLADLQRARAAMAPTMSNLATADLAATERLLRQQAAQRLLALGATSVAEVLPPKPPAGTLASTPAAMGDHPQDVHTKISDEWLNRPSRIELAWLPGFFNDRLSRGLDHLKANALAMKSPGASRQEAFERLLGNFFGVLPQTMFVMIPLFALLLKLFYVFRRRLYMEHLIVALHSHAYLFLSLLLGVSLDALSSWLAPHAAWITHPLYWLEWGLWLWAPIYLLLMQKRIYRQGWPMTVLKYLLVGWCYCWLLLMALLTAGMLGLAY